MVYAIVAHHIITIDQFEQTRKKKLAERGGFEKRLLLLSVEDPISNGAQLDPAEACAWLHLQLQVLPLFAFPYNPATLPRNGLYFFYEKGEVWGHGGDHPRIVRIGTNTGEGNLANRISEHFLLDSKKMDFDETRPAPKDRSIFRKNLGRALHSKNNNPYLSTWDIDFTTRANRLNFRQLRDIAKEKEMEEAITLLLRENFSFRFIKTDPLVIDREEMEKKVIGTIAALEPGPA